MEEAVLDTLPNLPKGSILDPLYHERLIMDLAHVCEVARVTPQYVHSSMVGVATDTDIEWVKTYREHKRGLVMTGANQEVRCSAICGAFLRNFIDARIIRLNTLFQDIKSEDREPENPTVLIIPNLYVETHGKALMSWQIQSMYDLLAGRLVAGRVTVVYVQNIARMRDAYGDLIAEHFQNNYALSA